MNPYKLLRYTPIWLLNLLVYVTSFMISFRPNHGSLRTIAINLYLVYPHLSSTDIRQLARKSLTKQLLNMVISLKSWAMPPAWSIKQIKQVHNQQILLDALANPNGMLAIVPHLGAWEIMNPWLNQFGSPTILYKPVKGKLSNEFALAGRQRLNATLVPTDGSGIKALLKTLKSGGFSIILPDHVPEPSGGVVVPFFGIETLSSTLTSKLASKTQCSLVGLTCVQRANGDGFEVYCDQLDDPNLYSKNMYIAVNALNHAMEKMISRFPDEYIWGYKRFKHNQFGRQDIYWLDDDTIQKISKR